MPRLASPFPFLRCSRRLAAVSRSVRVFSSSPTASTCSTCGADLGLANTVARCSSCSAFTPPPPVDGPPSHFELFELTPGYRIDRAELKRRFLGWQQRVHPDTVRGSSDGKQVQWARDWSGRVNSAYKALDQPLPRAEYMLALQGASSQETDQVDDPTLLMEVLEVREALEEAETEEAVNSIRSDNQVAMHEVIQGLETAFDADNLELAKTLSIKLRYLQNIEDVTREWRPGQPLELHH